MQMQICHSLVMAVVALGGLSQVRAAPMPAPGVPCPCPAPCDRGFDAVAPLARCGCVGPCTCGARPAAVNIVNGGCGCHGPCGCGPAPAAVNIANLGRNCCCPGPCDCGPAEKALGLAADVLNPCNPCGCPSPCACPAPCDPCGCPAPCASPAPCAPAPCGPVAVNDTPHIHQEVNLPCGPPCGCPGPCTCGAALAVNQINNCGNCGCPSPCGCPNPCPAPCDPCNKATVASSSASASAIATNANCACPNPCACPPCGCPAPCDCAVIQPNDCAPCIEIPVAAPCAPYNPSVDACANAEACITKRSNSFSVNPPCCGCRGPCGCGPNLLGADLAGFAHKIAPNAFGPHFDAATPNIVAPTPSPCDAPCDPCGPIVVPAPQFQAPCDTTVVEPAINRLNPALVTEHTDIQPVNIVQPFHDVTQPIVDETIQPIHSATVNDPIVQQKVAPCQECGCNPCACGGPFAHGVVV